MADRLGAPMRILVIDDDWTTRETFQHMLIEDGYSVSAAATVETGLAEAAANTPVAILLDLHMPVADGLECLRQLRSTPQWSQVPVAILTGDYFLDDDVARELRDLGARIHFKPLWDDDLRRVVRDLVDDKGNSPVSPAARAHDSSG